VCFFFYTIGTPNIKKTPLQSELLSHSRTSNFVLKSPGSARAPLYLLINFSRPVRGRQRHSASIKRAGIHRGSTAVTRLGKEVGMQMQNPKIFWKCTFFFFMSKRKKRVDCIPPPPKSLLLSEAQSLLYVDLFPCTSPSPRWITHAPSTALEVVVLHQSVWRETIALNGWVVYTNRSGGATGNRTTWM